MQRSRRIEIGSIFLPTLFFWALPFFLATSLYAADPATENEKEAHSHEAALQVATEDPVLKEQIVQVTGALQKIHQEMTRRRKGIEAEADPKKKAVLYADLDALRKEHDLIERLLHELVEEARATEWTKIDEALRRALAFERYQERAYRHEEVLRDRQQ